jgi:hypothetical protein
MLIREAVLQAELQAAVTAVQVKTVTHEVIHIQDVQVVIRPAQVPKTVHLLTILTAEDLALTVLQAIHIQDAQDRQAVTADVQAHQAVRQNRVLTITADVQDLQAVTADVRVRQAARQNRVLIITADAQVRQAIITAVVPVRQTVHIQDVRDRQAVLIQDAQVLQVLRQRAALQAIPDIHQATAVVRVRQAAQHLDVRAHQAAQHQDVPVHQAARIPVVRVRAADIVRM